MILSTCTFWDIFWPCTDDALWMGLVWHNNVALISPVNC